MDVIDNNIDNKIFKTEDGSHSVFSTLYNCSYHSVKGAIQESNHIFIERGLKYYFENTGKNTIKILELGFGTGLNGLLTYRFSLEKGINVEYFGIESRPLSPEVISKLNYSEYLSMPQEIFFKMHNKCDIEEIGKYFSLTKIIARFEDVEINDKFDIIYFDAFGPDEQPHLWDRPFLNIMPDLLHHGGILITYSVKGSFKRALKSLGFSIEKLTGPPGKREILRAIKL